MKYLITYYFGDKEYHSEYTKRIYVETLVFLLLDNKVRFDISYAAVD